MSLAKQSLLWLTIFVAALGVNPLNAEETVIDSAKMPNRIFPQSEIQFIATDSGAIIRSIIDTRFPQKVFNKISQSELSNWGKNSDMLLYVETLKNAFSEYKKRKKEDLDQPLIVDFIAKSTGDKVIFYFGATEWKELSLSTDYIRPNQEYILKDVFGDEAHQLITQLRSLLNKEE